MKRKVILLGSLGLIFSLVFTLGHVAGSRASSRRMLLNDLAVFSSLKKTVESEELADASESVEVAMQDRIRELEALLFISNVGPHLPWSGNCQSACRLNFAELLDSLDVSDRRSAARKTLLAELETDLLGRRRKRGATGSP